MRKSSAIAALAAAASVLACGGEDGDGAGGGNADPACGDCHGTASNPAPPPGLDGSGAGAHAVHLAPSDRFAAVRCEHCHPVPATVDAPGHLDADRPADLHFTGLSAARGVTPAYGPEGCTVYCHGSGLLVEQRRSPPWDSTETLGCTGCHGMPPPPPHVAASDCARCHLGVIDAEGRIASASRHGDSVLSAQGQGHFVHLGGGGREDIPCAACHDDGRYLLRDHEPLETTAVCEPCHAPGTVDAAAWRNHPGLAGEFE